jgi:hypothetical protein
VPLACTGASHTSKTNLVARDQVRGPLGGMFQPLVDSNPSKRLPRRSPEELEQRLHGRASWPNWASFGTHSYRDDRNAFVIELRRAVAAVAESYGVDIARQGSRASLTALKYMDQVVRDAPYMFGRVGQYAWNAGASWAEIGNHLGVTKQAAWKRCSRRGPRTPTPSMLALQQSLDRLMQGDTRPRLYQVSWETPLSPLVSRHGALEGLRLLGGIVRQADGQLALLVAEARFEGLTWKMIGSTLAMGPQAAHKRFSEPVNVITDAARLT